MKHMHNETSSPTSHTIPRRLPTMMEPMGSQIGFPVLFTAYNDAAAMARPVTAAPSYKHDTIYRCLKYKMRVGAQQDNVITSVMTATDVGS